MRHTIQSYLHVGVAFFEHAKMVFFQCFILWKQMVGNVVDSSPDSICYFLSALGWFPIPSVSYPLHIPMGAGYVKNEEKKLTQKSNPF